MNARQPHPARCARLTASDRTRLSRPISHRLAFVAAASEKCPHDLFGRSLQENNGLRFCRVETDGAVADQEVADPLSHRERSISWQGDGHDGGARHAHYGHDVSQVHPQGLIPDCLGSIILEPKMAAVHEHFGRHEQLSARGMPQDRTIIAEPRLVQPPGCGRWHCRIQMISPKSPDGSSPFIEMLAQKVGAEQRLAGYGCRASAAIRFRSAAEPRQRELLVPFGIAPREPIRKKKTLRLWLGRC
jgi:hypothetical protein